MKLCHQTNAFCRIEKPLYWKKQNNRIIDDDSLESRSHISSRSISKFDNQRRNVIMLLFLSHLLLDYHILWAEKYLLSINNNPTFLWRLNDYIPKYSIPFIIEFKPEKRVLLASWRIKENGMRSVCAEHGESIELRKRQ